MAECSRRITGITGPADFKNKFIDQIYNITEESNDQEVLF
jgi:hydroxyethylthiazole kinase-like sugar kinase family protein